MSTLVDDYYHFDEKTQSLKGERSGRRYSLGQKLRVIVSRVDLESRQIDFQPAEDRGRRNKRQR